MLSYPFPALLTPFPRTLIIKCNPNNERIPPSRPFPVFLTHLPVIAFINEEATGCFNEAAIGAVIAPRNRLSCSFISCFTVSVLLFQHQLIDLTFVVTLQF